MMCFIVIYLQWQVFYVGWRIGNEYIWSMNLSISSRACILIILYLDLDKF